MLLVVFGAGASFDSDPRRPVHDGPRGWRPPLANELFSNREQFRDAFTRYGHMQPLIPRLLTAGDNQPLERMLAELEDEANDYPARRNQLAAVQYYLHYLITQCENQWSGGTQGITNYLSLLDRIYRWGKGNPAVMFVTFNYDRLLENAASHRAISPPVPTGNAYEDMDSYIRDARLAPVLKLHGSIDWGRKVALANEAGNGWNAAYWVIDNLAKLAVSDKIEKIVGLPPPDAMRSFPRRCSEGNLADDVATTLQAGTDTGLSANRCGKRLVPAKRLRSRTPLPHAEAPPLNPRLLPSARQLPRSGFVQVPLMSPLAIWPRLPIAFGLPIPG